MCDHRSSSSYYTVHTIKSFWGWWETPKISACSYFTETRMESGKQPKILEEKEGRCLPQHIVYDILLRLPAKSLLRFKCVCKEWFSMISDPDFAKVNFQLWISKIMIMYWIPMSDPAVTCAFKLEEKGMKARKLDSVVVKSDYNYCPEQSCNSLVLLEEKTPVGRLCLYDAISHKQKLLPVFPRIHFDNCYSLIFDSSNRKYRVIVFSYELQDLHKLHYIYMLDFGTWSDLEDEIWRELKPSVTLRKKGKFSSIFLKGILYWIACAAEPVKPVDAEAFVQPLDMATENFLGRIQVPCQPHGLFSSNYNLFEMKGSLCLMNAASVHGMEIWMLKDSAHSIWTKQHEISLLSVLDRPKRFRSMYEFDFYPWLVVESCNDQLTSILVHHNFHMYWYNMVDRKLKRIAMEFGHVPGAVSVLD